MLINVRGEAPSRHLADVIRLHLILFERKSIQVKINIFFLSFFRSKIVDLKHTHKRTQAYIQRTIEPETNKNRYQHNAVYSPRVKSSNLKNPKEPFNSQRKKDPDDYT